MTTLTLQIDSPTIVESLKHVLSLLKGVRIVSDEESNSDVPNPVTLEAMKEAETGPDAGLVNMDSLDSFMESMED